MAMLSSKIKRLSRGTALALSLAAAGTLVLPGRAAAQTARPDRPDVYTVVKGDTLWDISGRFLQEPWLWPEIWEANPQIENPHLIYPGDQVSLVFVGGSPRLRLHRDGRPVVKLGPSVRVVQRGRGEIPSIPIDAILQFLSRPRVVAEAELDRAPYIVSVGKEHLVAGAGFRVYARGPGLDDTNRFSVYRKGTTYVDPRNDEVIGFEAIHLGDAVLERPGDPATLRLVQTKREVLSGDRLLAIGEEAFDQSLRPRIPGDVVDGSIIEVVDGVTQIGQYQVVVLNLGARDGVEPGSVLSVYQKGEEIVDELERDPREDLPTPEAVIELDPEKQGGMDGFTVAADRVVREIERSVKAVFTDQRRRISLPEERAGTIMVFRSFDRISYALVMDAVRPMHILDSVRNP